MEKVINSYECLFIVDVANGEEATAAKVNKFTALISNNAEIVEVDEWGKRRLAYLINDKAEGYYVIVTFKSAPEFIHELERKFNIDEAVMRYLVTKLDFEPKAKAAETVAEEAEVPATTEE
jgi:small subunit ribosomal protein S6